MMASLPFALLVPGQPVIANFEQTSGIYHTDIPSPRHIANISLFLTSPIPEGFAIALYYSLPPYSSMEFLGAVANAKSSDTFSTGFPFKTQFQTTHTVKLCLKAQSFEEIGLLVKASDGQKEYSKLVAQNLFNFMMSFNVQGAIVNGQGGQEFLVVPTNVFTKWMNKFDEKYAKDPNFILKTTLG